MTSQIILNFCHSPQNRANILKYLLDEGYEITSKDLDSLINQLLSTRKLEIVERLRLSNSRSLYFITYGQSIPDEFTRPRNWRKKR